MPSQLPVNATAKTAFPIYYSTMSLLNNNNTAMTAAPANGSDSNSYLKLMNNVETGGMP